MALAKLWTPRVRELDGEAVLVELGRVLSDQAGEARARCVNDVQIAIGTVIPAQSKVGAHRLRIGGIHLDHAGECQKA